MSSPTFLCIRSPACRTARPTDGSQAKSVFTDATSSHYWQPRLLQIQPQSCAHGVVRHKKRPAIRRSSTAGTLPVHVRSVSDRIGLLWSIKESTARCEMTSSTPSGVLNTCEGMAIMHKGPCSHAVHLRQPIWDGDVNAARVSRVFSRK